MVTQRELLGTFSYFFILALALFLYQHAMFAEALQASSVGMFIFLLYIGIAEFYWLFKYFMRYFHWFFHKKEQVIGEIKGILLAYLVFLITAILANTMLQSEHFLVILAVILPVVVSIVAFIVALVLYVREHPFRY